MATILDSEIRGQLQDIVSHSASLEHEAGRQARFRVSRACHLLGSSTSSAKVQSTKPSLKS